MAYIKHRKPDSKTLNGTPNGSCHHTPSLTVLEGLGRFPSYNFTSLAEQQGDITLAFSPSHTPKKCIHLSQKKTKFHASEGTVSAAFAWISASPIKMNGTVAEMSPTKLQCVNKP